MACRFIIIYYLLDTLVSETCCQGQGIFLKEYATGMWTVGDQTQYLRLGVKLFIHPVILPPYAFLAVSSV